MNHLLNDENYSHDIFLRPKPPPRGTMFPQASRLIAFFPHACVPLIELVNKVSISFKHVRLTDPIKVKGSPVYSLLDILLHGSKATLLIDGKETK